MFWELCGLRDLLNLILHVNYHCVYPVRHDEFQFWFIPIMVFRLELSLT